MISEKNNYAFIDSQNVNLAIRSQGWKLDWQKFRVYLSAKYNISKAYLFIGYVPGNEDFYIKLQSAGFICVFKPTLLLPNGKIKGNVDAELVMYAMIESGKCDQVLIVSGDGDFYCLVSYFINNKKLLKMLIPNQTRYSAMLKHLGSANDNIFDFMDDLEGKIGRDNL
jgi:uncharacterized LabA/DUF88 family protein